jgi:glycosyltransferase involved in cell wall biosynthesis
MRVLAIVPAFNESGAVADVVRDLLALGTVDVAVVNDGSTDETAALARAAGARVLDLPINLGIGGAVQCGFLHAARNGYEAAVQVDGDGQHLPREIARLLEPIARGDADLVLGSRFVGPTDYHAPRARRLGMLVFSAVVGLVSGQRLRDTTSGFRAAGRPVILYLAEHYPQDYPEVEALVLLKRAGFRIVETPCRFAERTTGRSSITAMRSAHYVVKVLLAILVGLFRRVPGRDGKPPRPGAPVAGPEST